MASKHIKRCSTLCVTKEFQIKTTVRCRFTQTGMAIIFLKVSNKYWQGCGELKSSYTACRIVKWCSHCEKLFLKMLNIYLWPCNYFFRNVLQEKKYIHVHTKTWTWMLTAALSTRARTGKTAQIHQPDNRATRHGLCPCSGILLSHERGASAMQAARRVNLRSTMHGSHTQGPHTVWFDLSEMPRKGTEQERTGGEGGE